MKSITPQTTTVQPISLFSSEQAVHRNAVVLQQPVKTVNARQAIQAAQTLAPTRRSFLGGIFGALGMAALNIPSEANASETINNVYADYEKLVGFKIADVSEVLENRETGESVRLIYGENGEFRVDYRIAPGGYIPFEHYHSEQDEIFRIIKGNFAITVDGVESQGKAGDVIVVPAGAAHIGHNVGNDEVQIIVTFDPLLDADELFRRYWQICDEGAVDRFGRPQLVRLLEANANLKSKTYPTNIARGLVDAAYWTTRIFIKK